MSAWPPPGSVAEVVGSVNGPANYQAGGFVVDLSAVFDTIDFVGLELEVPGPLPHTRWEITRNAPGAGQFRVRLVRVRYDRTTSVGNVQGQNGAVAVVASGGPAASVDAIGGVGVAHRQNQIYEHQHGLNQAATDAAATEIASGTDLSAAVFRYRVRGS